MIPISLNVYRILLVFKSIFLKLYYSFFGNFIHDYNVFRPYPLWNHHLFPDSLTQVHLLFPFLLLLFFIYPIGGSNLVFPKCTGEKVTIWCLARNGKHLPQPLLLMGQETPGKDPARQHSIRKRGGLTKASPKAFLDFFLKCLCGAAGEAGGGEED